MNSIETVQILKIIKSKNIRSIIFFSLVSILTIALPFSATAGTTSIYLTNSTLETMTVQVEQTGDDVLTQGDSWEQPACEIPPLETKEILVFSRDSGLENGKTYYFTTKASIGTSEFYLKQKIVGTLINSNMWLSASGSDFNPGWFYDRDVHKYETIFNGETSTVAFESQMTASFDKIHYIIQPEMGTQVIGAPNEFNVLSYNVWFTTVFGSKKINERKAVLPEFMSNYDCIVFSELIDDIPRNQLLDDIRGEYPYQTKVLAKAPALVNGGVVIASRFPILEEDATYYDGACVGIQCLAARGAAYAKINKQGNIYHVFGTHTQSSDSAEQREARLSQIGMLGDFIQSKDIPEDEPVLIAGDFNVNKLSFEDDYLEMLDLLDAVEPANEGNPYTFHCYQNPWAEEPYIEYLDYVLSSSLAPVYSTNRVRVPRSLDESLFGKFDLSDHYQLVGEFIYDTNSEPEVVPFPYYGHQVRLETTNGHILRVADDAFSFLFADSENTGTWESFKLIDAGGGKVALQAYNGKYIGLDSWLVGTLVARAQDINSWEKFKLVDLGNNRIALKADNGRYLKADFGGGAGISANGWSVKGYETFKLVLQ